MASAGFVSFTLLLEYGEHAVAANLLDRSGQILASGRADSASLADARAQWHDLSKQAEPDRGETEKLGRLVGQLLFPDGVGEEIALALHSGRLRLGLQIPEELRDLPWEAAYLPDDQIGFVFQHPAVRGHRICRSPKQLFASSSQGLLVAFADPGSPAYPPLESVGREFQSVSQTVASCLSQGLKIDLLEHATPAAVARKLEHNSYSIFHFVGHGDHLPTGGVLVLESGEPGKESLMYGDDLARMLLDAGVRLAVLSACDTDGAMGSVACVLSDAGMPSVVAMQRRVADVDAHLFARTLYAALAADLSLEEAVYEARMAIRGAGINWAAPVLTTSCPDDRPLKKSESAAKKERGNLPTPATSFIGRRQVIEQVAKALETERLIVLLGSGGIGKTRLSIEIGRKCASMFPQGVWQVLLESLTEPSEVLSAVARVFGIRDSSDLPIEDRLFDFLREQELLIILDNCEHLTDACRDATKKILSECPKVKILATSRIVLGTGADHVVPVPALSYPPVSDFEPNVFPVAETIENSEALQLLVARGKNASPGFHPKDSNIEALCRIVKRLDGIPLAIEIAASRFRSFTPQQVQEKLQKDLGWLDMEAEGAVDRHKTLRATLDWSYRLLSEKERRLFNRLGVFAATFSLSGAEAVGGFDPLLHDEVSEVLASLVDKSLVIAEDREPDKRYRLLDTCKAYALEALRATGEDEAAKERFLDYCVELSKSLYDILVSLDLVRWQSAIELEHDNLVSAVEWALREGKAPEKAGEIVVKAVDYWLMVGFVSQTANLIERILSVLPEEAKELQVRLNVLSGIIRVYREDREGLDQIKKAHARAVSGGDVDLIRYAAARLGECAYELQDEDTAVQMFEWVIRHCEATNDLKREGYVRLWLANIEISRGQYDAAERHLQEMISAKGKLVEIRGLGVANCTLAYLHQITGRSTAGELYRRGLGYLATIEDNLWLSCFLVLASGLLLPALARDAARIQGVADRLREESDMKHEPYMKIWVADKKRETRGLLNGRYEAWFNEGRTMGVDEALELIYRSATIAAHPME